MDVGQLIIWLGSLVTSSSSDLFGGFVICSDVDRYLIEAEKVTRLNLEQINSILCSFFSYPISLVEIFVKTKFSQ